MDKMITVTVETDPHTPGKYMVVLRESLGDERPLGEVLRIPARGLSLKAAQDLRDPIRFAFEAGFEHCKTKLFQVSLEIDDN